MQDNAIKYNFSDFTFEAYEKLIHAAKENHVFRFYNEYKENENFVLWRHDIDISVDTSLILSEIEKKNGVIATYFIHTHSKFYNYFEKDNFEKLMKIRDNGHQLALHFDCGFYDIQKEEQLLDKLEYEKYMLEKLIGDPIHVFSFHNPTEPTFLFDNYTYAGMINTYAQFFKKMAYASDSNGYWRNKSIALTIAENKHTPMQILTHPEWWTKDETSPRERIEGYIHTTGKELIEYYDSELAKYGRALIGR